MSQAASFLEQHLIKGTSNQIENTSDYLDSIAEAGFTQETVIRSNEVFIFSDGSGLVRIDDEVFSYSDIDTYK